MLEYSKEIKLCKTLTNGYLVFRDKSHPLSQPAGWVYHHRHVASIKYGRWLNSEEIVHHKDGNRLNNEPENLEVMSKTEHGKTHYPAKKVKVKCRTCGIFNERTGRDYIRSPYCSKECRSIYLKQFRKIIGVYTKEELEELVKKYPFTKVAKIIGCSDVLVKKTCVKLGIDTSHRERKRKNSLDK